MRIRFTRKPTFTKAVVAAAAFGAVFLATNSNLPMCTDPGAVLNPGGCLERQSYLHTWSGWLALISLAAGVLLLVLKQRTAATPVPQAPSHAAHAAHPAWPGVPGQPAAGPGGLPGHGQPSGFCGACGTRAVPGDSACRQCGARHEPANNSDARTRAS